MSKFTDEWGAFTAVPNAFIEQSQNLSGSSRWLFVLLRFRTHQQRECAWPSYDQLRSLTGWGTATITKAIKELEEHGWLERRKRFGKSVVYVLKRPSSSETEELENEELDGPSTSETEELENTELNDSTSETEVLQKLKHSSSETEAQFFRNESTPSIHDQEELSRRKGSRREGADAQRAKESAPPKKSFTTPKVDRSPANKQSSVKGKMGKREALASGAPKSKFHRHPSVVAYRDVLGFNALKAAQADLIAEVTGTEIERAPPEWLRFLRDLAEIGYKHAHNVRVAVLAFEHYRKGVPLSEALRLAWDEAQGRTNSEKGETDVAKQSGDSGKGRWERVADRIKASEVL
jgi:DNA-binding transcriptional MocR family regulator